LISEAEKPAEARNILPSIQALVGDAQFGPGVAFEQIEGDAPQDGTWYFSFKVLHYIFPVL
jgi:hypothetical protein